MRLERVVIATDFSERSIAAAQWVARSFVPKAELMLVHVLESPPPPHFLRRRSPRRADGSDALRTGARERLRQIRRQLGKGLISEQLREGRAHEEVLRAASEFAADLIVVGSHRDKPGFWNRFGSTAERILGGARTPVLVVHGAPRDVPRTLLAAIDDSETGITVLGHAESLVRRLGASGTAMHVLPRQPIHPLLLPGELAIGNEHLMGIEQHYIEETREWLTGRLGLSNALTPTVVLGDVAESILVQSRRAGADLLILGRERQGTVRRYLLGSVTSNVLRGANCAVLVIPSVEDSNLTTLGDAGIAAGRGEEGPATTRLPSLA